ncbi:RlmF-related methyltransferase [Pseudomonas sp. HK3]
MHSNNPHANGYDMQALAQALPELKPHLLRNKYDRLTINFSDALAVKLLNKALLKNEYGLQDWDIPPGFLCPPIPGRVDYLFHLQEYLEQHHFFSANKTAPSVVSGLDIGTGANVIYPLLANRSFNWHMVGSDIDDVALSSAKQNLDKNAQLDLSITLRKQSSNEHIFKGIIQADDYFHVTLCNPPFHESQQAAIAGSVRKNKNLNTNKKKRASNVKKIDQTDALNFAGQSNELWCKGR